MDDTFNYACNMNTFFSIDLFVLFIYQNVINQQLRTMKKYTQIKYEILYTLNLGCSFTTLREPCNNQRSRCDIAFLYYKSFIPRFYELN